MKLKTFFLIFISFLCAFGTVRAQGVHFEKDSLTRILIKARQQNKPVFLLLSPPPHTTSRAVLLPKPRNEISLNTPAVAATLNKSFLNKELFLGTAETADMARRYTVSRYPTYLSLGPEGSLLQRSAGFASGEQYFLDDLHSFRQAQADPQNLSTFKTRFQQGNREVSFLKQYISKCRQMGQLVDSELLDAYVKQLPARAFDHAAEVVFVLDNGPVVGSKAQQLTHRNSRLYDSLYRALPLAQRIAINNRITANTMAQAIATKDRKLA